MLQRRHRLRRTVDISRVRRFGLRRRHSLATLRAWANNRDDSRFAISASRQVGNAVVRNRAKRRLREAIRKHLPEIVSGWDCLFVLSPAAAAASYGQVEEAMLQLLAQAQLLRSHAGERTKAP